MKKLGMKNDGRRETVQAYYCACACSCLGRGCRCDCLGTPGEVTAQDRDMTNGILGGIKNTTLGPLMTANGGGGSTY